MQKLENFISNNWVSGDGEGQILFNAINHHPIISASTKGIDMAAVLHYGRSVGNPALRKMTFHERGNILKALALHLQNTCLFFMKLVTKLVPPKQIVGLILKVELEIFLAMHRLGENFPTKLFV